MIAEKNIELKKLPNSRDGSGKASVIDLGSNSVKLVNYNIDSHNTYKPYHQESIRIKLAEGLVDGVIQQKHIEKTLDSLKLFRSIIDFEQIDYVLAVATSAVRDAKNKEDFIEQIQKETGFNFKILSEHEEAIYSHAGAIRSLNLPSTVFFDIGGGSLEIVSSKNFEIQKVISLPLGSLRLSQKFSNNSDFSEKRLSEIKTYVQKLLPGRKSLGISDSDSIVLVGVGGTLRAIAKYNQEKTNYPLKKLHNYLLSLDSLKNTLNDFSNKNNEELSKIESIGSGRSDTIKTGLVVVFELMKKLDFSSLVVSAQGLREGTLSLSLQYRQEFSKHEIDISHVEELIQLSCQPDILSEYVEDLVRLLFSMKLISDKERVLLAQSISYIDTLSSFRDVDNVLYTILDNDSILSHREQLIVALSLIYSKKKKKAESLITRFEKILGSADKRTIKKISAVVSLCDISHKTGTLLTSKSDNPDSILLKVHVSKNHFPEVLLNQACKKIENVLGIQVKLAIYYETSEQSKFKPLGIT